MISLADIEKKNKIDENEFKQMTQFMYNSFIIKSAKTDDVLLEKKALLISSFTDLLNKFVEFKFVENKKTKIEFIDFIDKLNLQKEFINLQKGNIDLENLKVVSDNLGRKAQSAFETK